MWIDVLLQGRLRTLVQLLTGFYRSDYGAARFNMLVDVFNETSIQSGEAERVLVNIRSMMKARIWRKQRNFYNLCNCMLHRWWRWRYYWTAALRRWSRWTCRQPSRGTDPCIRPRTWSASRFTTSMYVTLSVCARDGVRSTFSSRNEPVLFTTSQTQT